MNFWITSANKNFRGHFKKANVNKILFESVKKKLPRLFLPPHVNCCSSSSAACCHHFLSLETDSASKSVCLGVSCQCLSAFPLAMVPVSFQSLVKTQRWIYYLPCVSSSPHWSLKWFVLNPSSYDGIKSIVWCCFMVFCKEHHQTQEP